METLSELNVRIGQMKNDALQFGPGEVEILKEYGFGNKGGNAFFAQGMLEIDSAHNCDACMAVKTADKKFSLVFTSHIQFTRDDQVLTIGAKNSNHRKGSFVQVEGIHVDDGTTQGGNLKIVAGDDGAGHVGDILIPSLGDEGYLKMTGGVLGTIDYINPYNEEGEETELYTNMGTIDSGGGLLIQKDKTVYMDIS